MIGSQNIAARTGGWRPSPPFFALGFLLLAVGLVTAGKAALEPPGTPGRYNLVISSPSTKKRMALPMQAGDRFTIRYIHSVDLLPVYEDFQVLEAGAFMLLQTRQHTLGAGLGDWQGELKLEDGLQVIKNINKVFYELPLFVGRIADHTVLFDGTETPLTRVFAGGERVVVRIEVRR
jgi:hypothetical protein